MCRSIGRLYMEIGFRGLLSWAGVAALVNVLSRIALNYSMSYESAILVAYVCGMTTAYVLNKLFVFPPSLRPRPRRVPALHHRKSSRPDAGMDRQFGPRVLFLSYNRLHLACRDSRAYRGCCGTTFTSYLGHRYFSFAPRKLPLANNSAASTNVRKACAVGTLSITGA